MTSEKDKDLVTRTYINEVFAAALQQVITTVESTDENARHLVLTLLEFASAGAVRFECDELSFVRMARMVYQRTVLETRKVDAEDDN